MKSTIKMEMHDHNVRKSFMDFYPEQFLLSSFLLGGLAVAGFYHPLNAVLETTQTEISSTSAIT